MKKTRLVTLFQTLSNKEIKELRLFIESPFFNKRIEVTLLFEYLVDTIHLFPSTPEKKKAFKYIHSNLKKSNEYNDQLIRLWMSFLFKLIEKYLLNNAYFQEEIKTKTKLVEIYRKRNLSQHQERVLLEVQSLQTKQPFRNAEFYEDDFQIQLEKYKFTSASKRMSALNLQQISDNLDIAYLTQKLRQSCISLSHQAVFKTEYQFGLLDEILNYIKKENLLKIPAIAVYYYCYQMLTQPLEAAFFPEFKKAIATYGNQFPKDELGDLYILGINFCIKRYNEGNRIYLKDEFDLYKEGLRQQLFLKNKSLSRFSYRNIVTIGLILEEFKWIEQFIYDYKSALDKVYRESMFSFSLARLEYSRKNYKAALLLLQKSEYKDLLLNLAAKTVLLKIFYELEELDSLNAHLEAMRTFIRRKKDIGYHQENYLNLIYFTKKLMEYNPYERQQKTALQEEIRQTKAVAEKEWLLKQ